jgi:4-diphosphocytidyl-2-C-methyl-D-erythritol kinase
VYIEYKSYAKLNMYLKVLGYVDELKLHKLSMINTEIDFSDEIIMELAYPGRGIVDIYMNPDFSIKKEDNLIFKAVKTFIDRSGLLFDAFIKVKKNIPPGSGLGGGSSNASYTLLALNKIFNKFNTSELKEIASSIGSDAPFFIYGGLCKVEGSGEIVEMIDIPDFNDFTFVVVIPPFSLSTREVYEKFDSIPQINDEIPTSKLSIQNDLYNAARIINPEIEKIISRLKEMDPLFTSMTGSGSVCFAGFKDQDKAIKAHTTLKREYEKVILARPKLSRNTPAE